MIGRLVVIVGCSVLAVAGIYILGKLADRGSGEFQDKTKSE